MTEAFMLHPREVAAAARKAQEEGRLGYQRGHASCLYRYSDGACCAIGAAIPDEAFNKGWEGVGLLSVITDYGALTTPDHEAYDRLRDLQEAHDALCTGRPEQREGQLKTLEGALVECERYGE